MFIVKMGIGFNFEENLIYGERLPTKKEVLPRAAEKVYHVFGSSTLERRRVITFLYVRGNLIKKSVEDEACQFSLKRLSMLITVVRTSEG
jgi:hypothetical protein